MTFNTKACSRDNMYCMTYANTVIFFCTNAINTWNSLQDSRFCSSRTFCWLDLVKDQLDKHCMHQDMLFNFKAELTGNSDECRFFL